MIRGFASLILVFVITCVAPQRTPAVTIPTVPVGDPGNANDPLTGNRYGSVTYNYRIGTTEVTNSQYVDFLNAKAASDPLGLYNVNMDSDARGGITRNGPSGSFTYTTKNNMGNKPVNYVTWFDAIRFANWLNNGQGAGSTEVGAYSLGALGANGIPVKVLGINRNAGATWFLPNMHEWYKAAFYQPAAQGGDADNYWLYPTKSNSAPTVAAANANGDISNPGTNVANYNRGADWNGLDGNLTTVGSAGPLSQTFYGTWDQAGNVFEWSEAAHPSQFPNLEGSGFERGPDDITSFRRSGGTVDSENYIIGFRVAAVPEPSTLALAMLGALSLLIVAYCKP